MDKETSLHTERIIVHEASDYAAQQIAETLSLRHTKTDDTPIDKEYVLSREWALSANCRGADPELFFPERGASTKRAKAICRKCVVIEPCLEFALLKNEKGIRGGKSYGERAKLRRARKATDS
jgi:WhiB family redox-sensing transcriptional regulator